MPQKRVAGYDADHTHNPTRALGLSECNSDCNAARDGRTRGCGNTTGICELFSIQSPVPRRCAVPSPPMTLALSLSVWGAWCALDREKNIVFATDSRAPKMRQTAHNTAGAWDSAGPSGNNANAYCTRDVCVPHAAAPEKIEPTHPATAVSVCTRHSFFFGRERRTQPSSCTAAGRQKSHLLRRAGRSAGGGGRHPCPHPRERSERSHPSTPKCNPESFCLLFSGALGMMARTLSSRLPLGRT